MFFSIFLLREWKREGPAHRLLLKEEEALSTVEEGQVRLQDHAFTREFALAQELFQKQRGTMLLDCSLHYTRKGAQEN